MLNKIFCDFKGVQILVEYEIGLDITFFSSKHQSFLKSFLTIVLSKELNLMNIHFNSPFDVK